MGKTMNINGHTVTATGTTAKGLPGNPALYRCEGCGETVAAPSFENGPYGCPGDPASTVLQVCPGGERCEGHRDTDSAEYRAWKEIASVSEDTIPTYRHGDPADRKTGLAYRAASAYIAWADGVGMRFSVWAQEGFKVGPDGGKVAEMTFRGESWAVWVDHFGHITARRDN
jgi:hypothetical protein